MDVHVRRQSAPKLASPVRWTSTSVDNPAPKLASPVRWTSTSVDNPPLNSPPRTMDVHVRRQSAPKLASPVRWTSTSVDNPPLNSPPPYDGRPRPSTIRPQTRLPRTMDVHVRRQPAPKLASPVRWTSTSVDNPPPNSPPPYDGRPRPSTTRP